MLSSQIPCIIVLTLINFSNGTNNDGFNSVVSTTQLPDQCTQNPNCEELKNTILAFNKKLELRLESFEAQMRKTQNQLDELLSSPKDNLSCNRKLPRNCQEVLEAGHAATGVYKIKPEFATEEISVLCDMRRRGGGWTYILNRYDGSQDFYLDWNNYKDGFGPLNGEFWLGLENIYLLTGYELNEFLIELVDWEGKEVFAHYDIFTIGGEKEGYLWKCLEGYSGDAGEILTHQVGMKFTTKDKDQDVLKDQNCAIFSSGGWWYRDCKRGHPTGVYLGQHFDPKDNLKGIFWETFHGNTYSLKEVRMMVRPSRPMKTVNPAF